MALTKITTSDLANKGVIGLPDVPGLSTSNMQFKLEETARDVIIPKHNGLIDELEENTGASNIGATAPTGLTGTNVQALIDDLNLKKENNPSSLSTVDAAEANDTFILRRLTTSYKIAFSDLVNSIKTAIGSATSSVAGLFSAADKTKLDGIEANANDYTLPIASASELGGFKVGENLEITSDGTLNATASGNGDMTKAVYDTNDDGIVDAAESVPWSGVTSKPTTVAGYGITDTYTKTEVDTALNGKVSNAYKRVTVGATNVDASGEDAFEIEAGTGMNITADASTKKIVFNSTGGGSADTYKTIKVGSTDIVASGQDTLEFKAGSNVTLTPDATNKTVTISATGGGSSSGDMLAADYDSDFDVKAAGGIKTYVTGAISNKVDKVTGKGLSTNDFTDTLATKLNGIAAGAEVNVQSDWNVSDSSSDAFIKNKPTIPAAQVNADWNASSGKAEIYNKPTLGTAAAKNSTSSVTSGSTDLVESGAVAAAIGDKADLTLIAPIQSTLTASKAYAVGEQFVYNQVLYKVTQAIAQGATFTIGTNCELASNITDQINHENYTMIGFTGTASSYTLTDKLSNYKYVYIDLFLTSGSTNTFYGGWFGTREIFAKIYYSERLLNIVLNTDVSATVCVVDDTHINVTTSSGVTLRLFGIK